MADADDARVDLLEQKVCVGPGTTDMAMPPIPWHALCHLRSPTCQTLSFFCFFRAALDIAGARPQDNGPPCAHGSPIKCPTSQPRLDLLSDRGSLRVIRLGGLGSHGTGRYVLGAAPFTIPSPSPTGSVHPAASTHTVVVSHGHVASASRALVNPQVVGAGVVGLSPAVSDSCNA